MFVIRIEFLSLFRSGQKPSAEIGKHIIKFKLLSVVPTDMIAIVSPV